MTQGRTDTVDLSDPTAEGQHNHTHVHDDQRTEMFPIKTSKRNVHKTRVNMEMASVH